MSTSTQHPYRDFVLIINPISGKGKAAAVGRQAFQRLTTGGYTGQLELTTQPGDANRIARKAVDNGSHWIIACGGDGTIHEVVNAIAEKPDVVLGVLPCGSMHGVRSHNAHAGRCKTAWEHHFSCAGLADSLSCKLGNQFLFLW